MPTEYRSGFCDIGCHEGDNPKNLRGNPLPTCKMSSSDCSCDCHKLFDQMFEMSNKDRVNVNLSSYEADSGGFLMPDFAAIAAERLAQRAVVPPKRIESPDPERVPSSVVRTFNDTPTGRSARGELEQQVDGICKMWAIDGGDLCTPKDVSEQIAKLFGIKAPSVGAIQAVWERWVKIGYATMGRKPVRFIGFTDEGIKLGLDTLKARARRTRVRA